MTHSTEFILSEVEGYFDFTQHRSKHRELVERLRVILSER